MTDTNNPYSDIIHLPHHKSATRPHMSMHDRAAQFSPFAALTGFDGGCDFMMHVATTGEAKRVVVKSNFFGAFIEQLCDFFLGGEVKVPHEETLGIMAVRGAVLKAQEVPGQWIEV